MESENHIYENVTESRIFITNILINLVLGVLVIYNLYQINKNLYDLNNSFQDLFM